tara:strand:+ start:417 stop:728 length:312 start_codon:yes stop_codon:yes gene_type:complete
MRDLLESQLLQDAIEHNDTTVLAELLSMLPDHVIYNSLSDDNREHFEPTQSELSNKEIEVLKETHEKIRKVLIEYGSEEYGDCIIDEICEASGIAPTTIYYEE